MYKLPLFWPWFFWGSGSTKPGWKGIIDKWLLLHLTIGFSSLALNSDLCSQAEKIILPFSGVLIGITFAWSGNITALLSTHELSLLSDINGKGIQEYAFSVQRSILIILIAVLLWCLVALGGYNNVALRVLCYSLSSIAIRESWQVILFAQYMTISRKHAADITALKDHGGKN